MPVCVDVCECVCVSERGSKCVRIDFLNVFVRLYARGVCVCRRTRLRLSPTCHVS